MHRDRPMAVVGGLIGRFNGKKNSLVGAAHNVFVGLTAVLWAFRAGARTAAVPYRPCSRQGILFGRVSSWFGSRCFLRFACSSNLSRVILLIRENYVDPARVHPYEMFLAALDNIQKTVPEVLVDESQAPARIKVAVGNEAQSFELGGLDQLWEMTMALRDIFRFLQTHVQNAEARRDIEYAAINGMLSTLDPHSILLKPDSFDEVKLSTKGEFGGLGIVISIRDAALTIVSPIQGTPASRVGLKAKDQIVKIGEESTINMGLEEAVQRLRGRPDTTVVLWIMRPNWTEPRKFVLTRAVIKIESVTSEMLDDGVGYIRIKSFQSNTYDDLNAHLELLRQKNKAKKLRGLVLDLRNNPGGLLDQAILVSDRFVARGPLVITVGESNRKREVKNAHFAGTESDYPMVVLINGGSASASEIVSGALQNHNRAAVIGQRSFGKGSVQVLYDFKDQAALKLTIAQYLTPGDISIQSVGIVPDVEVVPVGLSKDRVHLFAQDMSPREQDLDMHLEQHKSTGKVPAHEPIKVTHVVEEKDDEVAEEAAPDQFEYDFEIKLAHDILLQTKTSQRQEIIRAATPLFSRAAEEQGNIVKEELAKLGVDWQSGDMPSVPKAQLVLTKEVAGKPITDGVVKAGDELVLHAVVKNVGDAPLYRVYGVTDSDNPLLRQLEFPMGKIMPGAQRQWDVHIKLPKDMNARADIVRLKLGNFKDRTYETSTFVRVEPVPHPRFSYRYVIDDRAGGNGDGVLQVGEKVDFKVEVRNEGPGAAGEAMVTLKNLSGKALFLDNGRDKLGELAAGVSKVGGLQFALRKPTEAGTVKLKVSIWDAKLGAALSDTLTLPVEAARHGKTSSAFVSGKKNVKAPIYAGASEQMPIIGYIKPGSGLRSDLRFGKAWRRVETSQGSMALCVREMCRQARAALRKVDSKRALVRLLRRLP
ncbi:MAG: MXAN_5808 family serine peptidase [Myxococcota bacterium]